MHLITMQISSILLENGFDDIKVVEVCREITMTYEATTNEIRLNPEIVESYISNNETMPKWFDEDTILSALLFHELGHYTDFKQHPDLLKQAIFLKFNGTFEEYKAFLIEREQKAWDLGKELINEDFVEAFDLINKINMYNYERMELLEL